MTQAPNLQGLMELAAAVSRAQNEGRGREEGDRRGGEGEEMDDMIRHIVQCSPLLVLHIP